MELPHSVRISTLRTRTLLGRQVSGNISAFSPQIHFSMWPSGFPTQPRYHVFIFEGCYSHFLFYTDRSHCHCGLAPYPIYPSSASASAVAPVSPPIFVFSTCCPLCILILDWWRNSWVLLPLYVGQTITTPTSWDPTGGHLSGILREKFPKQPKCDSVQILSHPVVCPQVPALDVERLHPHPLTCILLLLLHYTEDKHPSLAPGDDH